MVNEQFLPDFGTPLPNQLSSLSLGAQLSALIPQLPSVGAANSAQLLQLVNSLLSSNVDLSTIGLRENAGLSTALNNFLVNSSPTNAVGDRLRQSILAALQQPTIAPNSSSTTVSDLSQFSIRAAGTVEIRGRSDLDGNPLDLQDDALIYAGQGFSIRGNAILPVQRDTNGNPLRDSQGRLLLVDRALAVSANNVLGEIRPNTFSNFPQVIGVQQIDIPSYNSLEQQFLTPLTNGIVPVTFNAARSNIQTAARWQQNFPAGGTVAQPRVIRVTNGDLNIPTGISLSNAVVIVENGDIDLRNGNQQFNNVTLVTRRGDILLGNVRATNLTALSSGELSTGSDASFNGNTLLTTANGNISFRGATTNLNASQNLRVISHGEIDYRSNRETLGSFLSTGDFVANGNTNLRGTISSRSSVFLNGNTTITAVPIVLPVDTTAPVISFSLTNDTGISGDRITNNPAITGLVTDNRNVTALQASLDGTNFVNILPQRAANGSINLNAAQLVTINNGVALNDGVYNLQIRAQDQAGNTNTASLSFTLDTTALAPSQLALSAASDSGSSNSDRFTNVRNPQITGSGEVGSLLTLFDGTQQVGQTTIGLDGTWQITVAPNLTDGLHLLTAQLVDRAGNSSVASASLAITIGNTDPVTQLTGTIQNTNLEPLVGILVELGGQQATTDVNGQFVLTIPAGSTSSDTLRVNGQQLANGITYPFVAESIPLLLGRALDQGVNNQINRPIFLPAIDVSSGTQVVAGVATVTTNPNIPNAQVTVVADGLRNQDGTAFTGSLSITAVPTNRTPAALPPNVNPALVVTIQPANAVFNPPALLTLPNRGNNAPGTLLDLWSINPATGLFDIVGQGQVSANGLEINTISGGIRNSSWHFFDPGMTGGGYGTVTIIDNGFGNG
jgi:Bacterial Ig-like domain